MLVFLLGVIVVGGGWFAYQKFYASKFAAGEELEEQMMGHQSLTLYGAVDKYPVTMQINIDKSKVSGTYYYNKKGPDLVLTLRGSLNAEGFMYLDEYDEKGTRTGSFSGYLSNGEYEGEFVTNKGKRMHFLVK